MKSARLIFGMFLLCFILSSPSYGQWYGYVGATAEWVRAPSLEGTIAPGYDYQLAGQYSLGNETTRAVWCPFIRARIIRQGYQQTVEEQTYRVNFSYLTLSPGIAYRPDPFLTASASLDFQGC